MKKQNEVITEVLMNSDLDYLLDDSAVIESYRVVANYNYTSDNYGDDW